MGVGRQSGWGVTRRSSSTVATGLWLVLLASPALAQTTSSSTTAAAATPIATTAVGALAVARAAFEYRDFAQVIRVLDPWVHPPRIQDPKLMVNARRLLGVSLHVQGDEKAAREEFAQLLLIDPAHRLDPFVIPPRVIASFEDVRRLLGPSLDRGLGPLEAEGPPSSIRVVTVPHPAAMWLPFGIPQVLVDESALGIAFGAAQVIGLALNVVAYFRGDSFLADGFTTNPSNEREVWVALQYSGLAVAGLAYAGSVAHGSLVYDKSTPPPSATSGGPVARITFRF